MKTSRSVRLTLLVTFLALTMAGSTTVAKKGVLLRFDPAPGPYTYEITQDHEMDMNLGPMGEQKTAARTVMQMTQEVEAAGEDGTRRMSVRYDRVVMDVDAGGQRMTFDSGEAEGAAAPPMAVALASLVGKQFTMEVTDQNEILALSGLEEIFDSMMPEDPSQDPQAAQINTMLRQGFGEETMKDMMQQGMMLYPDTPIARGDTWEGSTSSVSPVGEIVVQSEYRLETVEEKGGRDCLKIAFGNTMSIGGESPLLDRLRALFAQGGSETDLDWQMHGSQGSGSIWIEKSTGVVVDMEMSQDLGVSLTITSTDKTEPLTMNVQINQVFRNRLVEPQTTR